MSIALLRTTLVTFSVLVASLLTSGSGLKAMPIFFDIEITPISGPRVGGSASGSFSIDGNLFTETGVETFDRTSGLLSFDFLIDGFAFDIDYEGTIDGPFVTFTSGVLTDYDYATSPGALPAVFFLFPTEFAYLFIGDGGVTDTVFTITRRSITVAEPASLAIFGLGLLAMGGIARRFKS